MALLLPAPLALGQTAEEAPSFSDEALERFELDVRPIFAEHCASCHSEAIGNRKGGLSLDDRTSLLAGGDSGPAVVPGDVDGSLLVEAIRRESYEMPPEAPLSPRDQAVLERWVRDGAAWTTATATEPSDGDWVTQRRNNHWAWQPPREVEIPIVEEDRWSLRPLDRFVLQRLRELSLEPAGDASADILRKRLHVDLTGLPPVGPTGVGFAMELDPLLDNLLASPQFGVHWGRHWLDVMRYAETLGHEFDYPARHAWRYRDAVVNAWNDDGGYDQLVMEHLAGDRLAARRNPITGVNESLAMTGWWWLGDSVHAPVDLSNDWATRLDNQIDVFSKSFLGMTVACARCHDHKFDAIRQADYFALSGMIESSRRAYANDDPHDKISAHLDELTNRAHDGDRVANRVYSEELERQRLSGWVDDLVTALQAADRGKVDEWLPLDSPLHPLQLLVEEKSISQFEQALAGRIAQLEAAAEDYSNWQATSTLLADFRDGVPSGWTIDHAAQPAARWSDSRPLYDWFGTPVPLLANSAVFSSRQLGLEQHATLRSPNFQVSSRAVCIKVRGQDAQSALVVGNYFMQEFHGLLFGGLKKSIDSGSEAHWLTHSGDLNKYTGQPAFVSIEDAGKGWFEVEEVRLADGPPPVQASVQALAGLQFAAAAPSGQQLDRLRQSIRETVHQALDELRLVAIGSPSTLPASAARDGELLRTARELVRLADRLNVAYPWSESSQLMEQREGLAGIDRSAPAPIKLLAIEEGTPHDVPIHIRGNPHLEGEVVARGCLQAALPGQAIDDQSSGRLETAQWLVSADNPLAARVIVNRVWHHLFGQGLVASPDNLGVLGSRPSHPELLDYLANELIAHEWSLKWLIREITSSRTYRLSSFATPEQKRSDPDARWLSHRSVRRLSAESIRDGLLQVAGQLDHQLAGESVPVYLTDQMTGRGRPGKSGPLDGHGRRTVFVEVRRNFLNPFLLAFDFPMPSTSAGRRNKSNVPAQALGMLNDPLVVAMADHLAQRTAGDQDIDSRIKSMFTLALARKPTPNEQIACRELLLGDEDSVALEDAEKPSQAAGEQGWQDLAHVLLNSKEFLYVR